MVSIFFRNIGALKLAPEQNKYYYQYFLSLGIQWEYMSSENDLKLMREFFMKYYGKKYIEIYDDALEKNKIYLNIRENKNIQSFFNYYFKINPKKHSIIIIFFYIF